MINSMATCKGSLSADAAAMVAPGVLPGQLLELPSLDSTVMGLSQGMQLTSNDAVEVDLGEVYFLVMHFLANGPCTRAFGQLWNELLQHKLLPRRYHGWFSREGQPSGDENDDGLSLPLSYSDIANRHPNIRNSHLVDLLQQLLVNIRKSASPRESLHSKIVTAADAPTLLGSDSFSLLDSERLKQKRVIASWRRQLRWPHWQADQIHGLSLRELGGGFARHHRSPSVRTASYVIAKPNVFFYRIQIIKKLRGHRNAVYCAIFDRTGQHVITGSDDRLVKIWSTETGLCLRSCRGHEGDITDLAVSSSNKLVASASNDFSIRVWRLPDGFPVSVLRGHGGAVTAIAFSPRQGCEHHLLSSSDDGTCRIWDARDSGVNSRVYMPDPKENQITARGTSMPVPQGTTVSNQILCCAFNADGSIFVTGSSDKLARVWNATKWNDELTGRPNYELDTLMGHENDVNYVQFSGCAAPSRPTLPMQSLMEEHPSRFKNTWSAHDSIVTCSRDGSAIIWTPRPRRHHAKAGRWIKAYHLRVPPPPMPPQPPRPGGPRQRLLPTPRGVNMIVWSLDNRFVLAAIMDCRICVWNAVDGSLVHSLTGHDKQTYVLDVHPFNPRIAMSAGYDGRVIIWDIWDGHPIRNYDTGDYNLVDGNFSPDGASLVVSDEVGQIYLFATGEGNSQKDAKYDQFFLGDFRPLVRDTHGNVLDQETQLPPHQRNIQDLLCDASMIPYSEPYQTIYQQRRLGALGIDWQPPAQLLLIGTLDDPIYTGPADLPIAFQAVAQRSPERRERRVLGVEGGNRWVEQPTDADETMDWEHEVPGVSDDTGSDYSASEETDDDCEKGESHDEAETEEDEDEEHDDDDDDDDDGGGGGGGGGRVGANRLRRSRRNKRKAEVRFSSSGRRLKKKRYDDVEESLERDRRSMRRRKAKKMSKVGGSLIRNHPERSTRPKRLAARNALHLFSSLNKEEEEETALHSEGLRAESSDKASVSGETQRVLRSRNKEEADETSKAVHAVSKVDSSDIGEFSRRPRSQRKLVVKLRNSLPRLHCENVKPEISGELIADTPGADFVRPEMGSTEDIASGSQHESLVQKPPRKLVIKPPKPQIGVKRGAAVLSSLEGSHSGHDNGEFSHRRQAHFVDTDDEYPDIPASMQAEDRQSWESNKGKGVKRVRVDGSPEPGGSTTASHNSGSCKSGKHLGSIQGLSCVLESKGQSKHPDNNIDNVSESLTCTCDQVAKVEDNCQGQSDRVTCELRKSASAEILNVRPNNVHMIPAIVQSDASYSEHLRNSSVRGQALEHKSSGRLENKGSNQDEDDLPYGNNHGKGVGVDTSRQRNGSTSSQLYVSGNSKRLAEQLEQDLEEQLSQPDVKDDLCQATHDAASFEVPEANGNIQLAQGCKGWDKKNGSLNQSIAASQSLPERLMSVLFSGKEQKWPLVSVDEPGDRGGEPTRSDPTDNGDCQMDDSEEDEVAESMQSGSLEQQCGGEGEANSESELFDSSGACERNWSESCDKGSDDESVDEGKRHTSHKRQRALGEFGLYSRQDSISSSRHDSAGLEIGKRRIRHMDSVLFDGGRETRTRSSKLKMSVGNTEIPQRVNSRRNTKLLLSPAVNGSLERVLRTRLVRYPNGETSSAGVETRRGARFHQGSTSADQEWKEDSVELDRKHAAMPQKSEDEDIKQSRGKDRRTSGRPRRDEVKREQSFDKDKGRVLEAAVSKELRTKKVRRGLSRSIENLGWLLLTDVEAGTRYIPQFGDHLVYLRQGHREFLEATQSEEKGPWRLFKSPIRAVEFCKITKLDYVILPDSGTCCTLTLKFTDASSKVNGKLFMLNLPELTDFPDFLVERTRYDIAMRKGWVVRDKCQVWWRSEDEEGGGKWWDGRVHKVKPKSGEFPDSPWERFLVLYKLDSSEPTSHSPWELFEIGNNRFVDSPRIDDESRQHLLSAISDLEKSCYVGNEDTYGLLQLRQLVKDSDYLNSIPLPLDLDIIRQRLDRNYYHSLKAFQHDVNLLVNNAQFYFGKDTEMADKMQRLAQDLLQALSEDEPDCSTDEEEDDFL